MLITSYIFFTIFAITSLIHLFLCFKENEILRKITKPFCLLFLLLAYSFYRPNDYLVYIGLLMALLGDIILINNKRHSYFVIGSLLFIASHLLYLVKLHFLLTNPLPYYIYLIALGVLLIIYLFTYRFVKSIMKTKGVTHIGNLYILLLFFMVAMSIYVAIKGNLKTGLLVGTGYICFIFSDIFLANTTFKKDIKRRDFYIMLSYLLAESLIIIGFALA